MKFLCAALAARLRGPDDVWPWADASAARPPVGAAVWRDARALAQARAWPWDAGKSHARPIVAGKAGLEDWGENYSAPAATPAATPAPAEEAAVQPVTPEGDAGVTAEASASAMAPRTTTELVQIVPDFPQPVLDRGSQVWRELAAQGEAARRAVDEVRATANLSVVGWDVLYGWAKVDAHAGFKICARATVDEETVYATVDTIEDASGVVDVHCAHELAASCSCVRHLPEPLAIRPPLGANATAFTSYLPECESRRLPPGCAAGSSTRS